MRKHIYIYLFILLYFFIMSSVSYGCEIYSDPYVYVSYYGTWYTLSGTTITFYGTAYDTDENYQYIVDYEWWVYDGEKWYQYDQPFLDYCNVYFPEPGYYTVELDVWDNEDTYAYDSCDIVVIGAASVSANEYANVNENVTFTVMTSPFWGYGYMSLVNISWSGGGDPATGSGAGAQFSTHWHQAGTYTVWATIGNSSEPKTVDVKGVKITSTGTNVLMLEGATIYTSISASGYPEGGTYHWEIYRSGNGNADLSFEDTCNIFVEPTAASSTIGDIKLKVTYTYGGVSYSAEKNLTIRKPTKKVDLF